MSGNIFDKLLTNYLVHSHKSKGNSTNFLHKGYILEWDNNLSDLIVMSLSGFGMGITFSFFFLQKSVRYKVEVSNFERCAWLRGIESLLKDFYMSWRFDFDQSKFTGLYQAG